MSAGRLVDLDELVLLCRNQEAKSYIQEAVACYRAGAFRSCIVATWTAVIYDFLSKLRQLDMANDKMAAELLKEFETTREEDDWKKSQLFEQAWLATARDKFELLTPIEFADFERLRIDRNRCAHPSMRAIDEIYQPTAELARCHLRNAVDHLLGQEPVQGKAALEKLERQWQQASFPDTVESAKAFLARGPIAKPRKSLIRNVVILLLKQLLHDDLTEIQQDQRLAALSAILDLHREPTESVLQEKLDNLMTGLDDEQYPTAIIVVSRLDGFWDHLGEHVHIRATRVMEQSQAIHDKRVLTNALAISDLTSVISSRLPEIDNGLLQDALLEMPCTKPLLDEAVRRFVDARCYREAIAARSELLEPVVEHLSPTHVDQILVAFAENNSVSKAHKTQDLMLYLIRKRDPEVVEMKDQWLGVLNAAIELQRPILDPLINAIRDEFPEFATDESPDLVGKDDE